jgi:hypothetical protein
MRDNLISSLNNTLNLQGINKLENLIFNEKDGSNPICSYETYISFIRDNLTQIKILDNHDMISSNKNNYDNNYNTYNNIPSQSNPWINNNNHNNNKKNNTIYNNSNKYN